MTVVLKLVILIGKFTPTYISGDQGSSQFRPQQLQFANFCFVSLSSTEKLMNLRNDNAFLYFRKVRYGANEVNVNTEVNSKNKYNHQGKNSREIGQMENIERKNNVATKRNSQMWNYPETTGRQSGLNAKVNVGRTRESSQNGGGGKPLLKPKSEFSVKKPPLQKTTPIFWDKKSPTPRQKLNFENWRQERSKDICGTGWQDRYRRLHEEIVSKHREEKYLVYLCPGTRQGCCGYGNRLRAVVSLFYLSVLLDRAFLIDWRAPEPIENHLRPRSIQWNYSEPTDVCSGLPIRKHYWGTTKADIREAEGWIIKDSSHFKKWLTTTDLEKYFDWPVEEITTIWYFAEGGLTLNPHLMKRAKELGIKPLISNTPKYNLIGCAFEFLFSKSKAVETKLNEVKKWLRFDGGPVIGIHIRTGDEQFDYFSSDYERRQNAKNISHLLNFFECARKVEHEIFGARKNDSSNVRYFVSTDNMEVRQSVQERFPRKVITSNLTILHLDILFNTTIFNFTAECNYTDSSNTTLVCYNVEIFNLTAFCLNRTNAPLEDGYNTTTTNETGMFTDGIIAMLVDHFLLAESDFLILCDSSFGSTAVGLGMRKTDTYTLADRGCVNLTLAQKNKRLRYFGRR